MLLERYGIDSFILCVLIGVVLAGLGMYALFSWATGAQNEGIADIDRMGCGELKEFIADKGWLDYDARWTSIRDHAMHTYTWTCEK